MICDDDMICFCSSVTAGTIRKTLCDGARTIDDIRRMTGACTVGRCKELSPRGRCCHEEINQLITEVTGV